MRTLADFSRTLSKAKQAQKFTAKELAQQTGLSSLAVRQILSGRSSPKLTNAMALAAQLGLELVLVPISVAEEMERPPQKVVILTDVERILLRLRSEGQDHDA